MAVADLDAYQGKISDAQISAITSQTGCVLPNDYAEFLRSCGFAFWTGHAVNGVFDDSDPIPRQYALWPRLVAYGRERSLLRQQRQYLPCAWGRRLHDVRRNQLKRRGSLARAPGGVAQSWSGAGVSLRAPARFLLANLPIFSRRAMVVSRLRFPRPETHKRGVSDGLQHVEH